MFRAPAQDAVPTVSPPSRRKQKRITQKRVKSNAADSAFIQNDQPQRRVPHTPIEASTPITFLVHLKSGLPYLRTASSIFTEPVPRSNIVTEPPQSNAPQSDINSEIDDITEQITQYVSTESTAINHQTTDKVVQLIPSPSPVNKTQTNDDPGNTNSGGISGISEDESAKTTTATNPPAVTLKSMVFLGGNQTVPSLLNFTSRQEINAISPDSDLQDLSTTTVSDNKNIATVSVPSDVTSEMDKTVINDRNDGVESVTPNTLDNPRDVLNPLTPTNAPRVTPTEDSFTTGKTPIKPPLLTTGNQQSTTSMYNPRASVTPTPTLLHRTGDIFPIDKPILENTERSTINPDILTTDPSIAAGLTVRNDYNQGPITDFDSRASQDENRWQPHIPTSLHSAESVTVAGVTEMITPNTREITSATQRSTTMDISYLSSHSASDSHLIDDGSISAEKSNKNYGESHVSKESGIQDSVLLTPSHNESVPSVNLLNISPTQPVFGETTTLVNDYVSTQSDKSQNIPIMSTSTTQGRHAPVNAPNDPEIPPVSTTLTPDIASFVKTPGSDQKLTSLPTTNFQPETLSRVTQTVNVTTNSQTTNITSKTSAKTHLINDKLGSDSNHGVVQSTTSAIPVNNSSTVSTDVIVEKSVLSTLSARVELQTAIPKTQSSTVSSVSNNNGTDNRQNNSGGRVTNRGKFKTTRPISPTIMSNSTGYMPKRKVPKLSFTNTVSPDINQSFVTVKENVLIDSQNVTKAFTKLSSTTEIGIAAGCIVAFWIVIGPILCVICRLRGKNKNRRPPGGREDDMSSRLVEEMIRMELARGREKLYRTSVQDEREIERLPITNEYIHANEFIHNTFERPKGEFIQNTFGTPKTLCGYQKCLTDSPLYATIGDKCVSKDSPRLNIDNHLNESRKLMNDIGNEHILAKSSKDNINNIKICKDDTEVYVICDTDAGDIMDVWQTPEQLARQAEYHRSTPPPPPPPPPPKFRHPRGHHSLPSTPKQSDFSPSKYIIKNNSLGSKNNTPKGKSPIQNGNGHVYPKTPPLGKRKNGSQSCDKSKTPPSGKRKNSYERSGKSNGYLWKNNGIVGPANKDLPPKHMNIARINGYTHANKYFDDNGFTMYVKDTQV